MEYLDYYDEKGNLLGIKARDEIHKEGLWHNTVHCWLYDKNNNMYFQIRKDENTFYTTASGHVLASETIKEAFGREVKEEIGIEVDYDNSTLVDVVEWKMDKIKQNGETFKDRAHANVYICELDYEPTYHFDQNEVIGLVKVNVDDLLKLFNFEVDSINSEIIDTENQHVIRNIKLEEFLVNEFETAISKYGKVINKIIEINQ